MGASDGRVDAAVTAVAARISVAACRCLVASARRWAVVTRKSSPDICSPLPVVRFRRCGRGCRHGWIARIQPNCDRRIQPVGIDIHLDVNGRALLVGLDLLAVSIILLVVEVARGAGLFLGVLIDGGSTLLVSWSNGLARSGAPPPGPAPPATLSISAPIPFTIPQPRRRRHPSMVCRLHSGPRKDLQPQTPFAGSERTSESRPFRAAVFRRRPTHGAIDQQSDIERIDLVRNIVFKFPANSIRTWTTTPEACLSGPPALSRGPGTAGSRRRGSTPSHVLGVALLTADRGDSAAVFRGGDRRQ